MKWFLVVVCYLAGFYLSLFGIADIAFLPWGIIMLVAGTLIWLIPKLQSDSLTKKIKEDKTALTLLYTINAGSEWCGVYRRSDGSICYSCGSKKYHSGSPTMSVISAKTFAGVDYHPAQTEITAYSIGGYTTAKVTQKEDYYSTNFRDAGNGIIQFEGHDVKNIDIRDRNLLEDVKKRDFYKIVGDGSTIRTIPPTQDINNIDFNKFNYPKSICRQIVTYFTSI